jgi:hypothetical protein
MGSLLSPLPIVLSGSLIDDRPNFLVIGYSASFDFGNALNLLSESSWHSGIETNPFD